jgi:hypothetical protein
VRVVSEAAVVVAVVLVLIGAYGERQDESEREEK